MKEKIVKKTLKNRFSFKFDKDLLCFVFLGVLAVLFLTTFIFQAVQNSKLQKQVSALTLHATQLELKTAQAEMIYVYSPEALVAKSPEVVAFKTNYTKKTAELTAEIEEAGEKIKKMKNGKDKEDFSELYLKSLVSKRNTLVEDYQKQLQDFTAKINQALENVMNANSLTAVFDSKVLLGRSNKVIDITDVVLQNFEELIKAK